MFKKWIHTLVKKDIFFLTSKNYHYKNYLTLQNTENPTSLLNYSPVFHWFLRHIVKPSGILEIGLEKGLSSKMLSSLAQTYEVPYVGIDPFPPPNIQYGEIIAAKSQEVLEKVLQKYPKLNIFVIDGDHNYETVTYELNTILSYRCQHREPYLIFLHDTTWPNAFRDSFYAPYTLPTAKRRKLSHPRAWVTYGKKYATLTVGTIPNTSPGFIYALKEGGERNGIIPAIKEAIVKFKDEELQLIIIPIFFGLGILLPLKKLNMLALIKLRFIFLNSLKIFFPILWTAENARLKLLTNYNKLRYSKSELASHTSKSSR